ncbi:hypothetical protein CB1_002300020 [Camelus ferus]|nr:hypothetical protein CB1_002300020 [Camelus ferus]
MKILGTIQILFGLMNFSFGIILLFTFENPYPRFPFIFVSGYPFWSSVLVTMSRTMNCLSALAATAGIILLTFGFILDQHYFCGYSEEASQCQAITTLFIAVQIMNGLFHIAIGGFLLIHMEVYVPICVILWYPFWGGIMGIFALLLIFALCQKLVTAGIVETEWKKMCSRRKANIVLLSAEEKKEQAIEIKEEVVEQPEIAPQPKNEEDIEIIPVQEEEEETEINFPEPPEEQESSPIENDGAP